MACLGSVLYDPGTLATKATSSLLAMTALDTTNARITFTAPANGSVLVRIRIAEKGATTQPIVLLGALDGSTIRGRQTPIVNRQGGTNANSLVSREAVFLVAGLTPGNSYTWDAAYGVETVVAATQLGWGGPNDTVANNGYGALSFEVWEATNLLGGTMYDPGTAVTKSTAAASVVAAIDTTNLRLAFTAPASGNVLVRLRCAGFGTVGSYPGIYFAVLQGASILGRQLAYCFESNVTATTDLCVYQSEFVVGGLTPAANLTWDAAWAVENNQTSTQFAYGGPDNTTANDAYGGFAYEIWSA